MFPGLTENRGTRQRLSASRRGVLKPWSVLPGTWQTPVEALEHGVFAPLACPRPASSQWQTQLRAGRKPRASRVRACEHVPRRRIDLRVAPPASSRSVPLPNASRSAPHWTGHEQDKRGSGDGDKECKNLMLMNENSFARRCSGKPCGSSGQWNFSPCGQNRRAGKGAARRRAHHLLNRTSLLNGGHAIGRASRAALALPTLRNYKLRHPRQRRCFPFAVHRSSFGAGNVSPSISIALKRLAQPLHFKTGAKQREQAADE
jgi:hypothetical protein